jgi:hypothetical protein
MKPGDKALLACHLRIHAGSGFAYLFRMPGLGECNCSFRPEEYNVNRNAHVEADPAGYLWHRAHVAAEVEHLSADGERAVVRIGIHRLNVPILHLTKT